MTRSKIFLGATTAVLAVAGVAAAKSYGPVVNRFYVTQAGTYCKAKQSICLPGGTLQCVYQTVINSVPATFNLFTKGPEGPKTALNCLQLLKYSSEH
jgi:hypothetical protein